MAKKEVEKPYKKISDIEYEVQTGGRTKLVKIPFEKVSKLFHSFISNGGIINPETGQVQTDILSLISSFKEVGDILLSEYDDMGKLVEQGKCSQLNTKEVIALFVLASDQISNFILELTEMQKTQTALTPSASEEK